jgi:hypothetical protein
MDKLRGVLERLAEAAEALGMADDERYALTQLVRLRPKTTRIRKRLTVLGGSLEEVATRTGVSDGDFRRCLSLRVLELSTLSRLRKPTSTDFEWNAVADEPATGAFSFADLNEPDISSPNIAAVEGSTVVADPFAS